jgi:hypothetical protein
MTMNTKSAAFLAALDNNSPAATPNRPSIATKADATPAPQPAPTARVAKPTNSRAGLKHIGGYFAREDVEKIAILRARLGLDNSQLIQLAVNELYKKHNAQRAFGDVK